MAEQEILVERDGAVATVVFNRPEQRNAISFEMWGRLAELARELGGDDSVRAVVFRGAGDRAFSAGADIKDFARRRHDSESAAGYAEVFEGAMDLIEEMPKPTISMIRGFCVGGGLEFATATDIRIAARGSRFGVPVARLGIVAGFKEMRRLVALAGPGNTAYIALSGELIDADEALRMGFITRLVAPEDLEDEVYGLARTMAAHAPLSHAGHKAILRTVLQDPGLRRLTPEERALQFRVFDTEDFRIGTAAFVSKTRPEFTGR